MLRSRLQCFPSEGTSQPSPEVLKLWSAPLGGRCWSSGGGTRVDCMRDIFIFIWNEIWVQDYIYIDGHFA
jgi:hypothetical protein